MRKTKTIRSSIIALFLILLFLPNPHSMSDLVLIFILVCAVIASFFLKNKVWLIWLVLFLFVVTAWNNSRDLRDYLAKEPVAETYRTDMDDCLKIFYLMKRGTNYYQSFPTAVEQNAFKTQVSTNLWSWRLPTIYYLWLLLPFGSLGIYGLFILCCLITLYAGYRIISLVNKQDTFGLLGAYTVFGYFHFGSRDPTLLQAEWWGQFPFIWGIWFWWRGNKHFAIICFTFAVLIRELFIIPIFIMAIYFALKKDTQWKMFLIPILLSIVSIAFHALLVVRTVGIAANFISPRVHELTRQIVLPTFAFGSWEYYWYFLRLFIVSYCIGLVALLKNWQRDRIILLASFFFPISFFILGSSVYNDYWGIFYVPVVLISVPLIVS